MARRRRRARRINWRHVNFLGGARTVETEAKWSSLEQGVRGTLHRAVSVPARGLASAHRVVVVGAEPIYSIAAAAAARSVTKEFGRAAGGRRSRCPQSSCSDVADPRVRELRDLGRRRSTDPSLRDEFIALGLDPIPERATARCRRSRSISIATHRRSRSIPRQGYSVSGHLETRGIAGSAAASATTKFSAKAGSTSSSGNAFVWANRVALARSPVPMAAEIPFLQAILRRRFDQRARLGPLSGEPAESDGLPIGGRTMIEVSTEARFGIRGKLSGVLFVDGGNVWLEPWKVQLERSALGGRARTAIRHADRADAGRPGRAAQSHQGLVIKGTRRSGSGGYTSASVRRSRRARSALRALRRLSRYVAIAVLVSRRPASAPALR